MCTNSCAGVGAPVVNFSVDLIWHLAHYVDFDAPGPRGGLLLANPEPGDDSFSGSCVCGSFNSRFISPEDPSRAAVQNTGFCVGRGRPTYRPVLD